MFSAGPNVSTALSLQGAFTTVFPCLQVIQKTQVLRIHIVKMVEGGGWKYWQFGIRHLLIKKGRKVWSSRP